MIYKGDIGNLDLKECLHCKSSNCFVYGPSQEAYTVLCSVCHCAGPVGATSKEAAESWNRRPLVDCVQAIISEWREGGGAPYKVLISIADCFAKDTK